MTRCDILEGSYCVCRLDAGQETPAWVAQSEKIVSITRTDSEISIICETAAAPPDLDDCQPGYRMLKVAGPLPFDAVGIISGITRPLADARIPVFVLSTYETDYLLVRETDLNDAVTALQGARIHVSNQ